MLWERNAQTSVVISVRSWLVADSSVAQHMGEVPQGILWKVLVADFMVIGWDLLMRRGTRKVRPYGEYFRRCRIDRRDDHTQRELDLLEPVGVGSNTRDDERRERETCLATVSLAGLYNLQVEPMTSMVL